MKVSLEGNKLQEFDPALFEGRRNRRGCTALRSKLAVS